MTLRKSKEGREALRFMALSAVFLQTQKYALGSTGSPAPRLGLLKIQGTSAAAAARRLGRCQKRPVENQSSLRVKLENL